MKTQSPKLLRMVHLRRTDSDKTNWLATINESITVRKKAFYFRIKQSLISISFLVLLTTNLYGQIENGSYFIQNKLTGNLFDIKGGHIQLDNDIWTYHLNYSSAQHFYIQQYARGDGFRISPYNFGGLVVSLVYNPMRQRLINETSDENPTSIIETNIPAFEAIADNDSISNSAAISDDFSLKLKRKQYHVYPILEYGLHPNNYIQVWKIIPVENESNTYFIQRFFGEPKVLQPNHFNSGSDLVLADKNNSDIQKWIILPARPNDDPKDLELLNFKWENGKISGKLIWKDISSNEDGHRIYVQARNEEGENDGEDEEIGSVGENIESFGFNFNTSHGVTEYIFTVQAFNKWGTNNNYIEGTPIPVEPEIHVTDVLMTPEPVESGVIPYTGSLLVTNAKVKKVKISGTQYDMVISFVKEGHTVYECGDSNSIVQIHVPPTTDKVLSEDQIEKLYGTSTPLTPISFVACIALSDPSPNNFNGILLDISWQKNN